MTNSLPIANLLSSAANIELTFLGGYIYPSTGVALGPITQQSVASLHVNKAILGIAGVTEDALYNANALMVEAEQLMMESADEVMVVADHSKFGKGALAKLCGWETIHRVVSDDKLGQKWRMVVGQKSAELTLADGKALAGIEI